MIFFNVVCKQRNRTVLNPIFKWYKNHDVDATCKRSLNFTCSHNLGRQLFQATFLPFFYVILIFLSVLVLPGERLVKLIHQDSQDDMAASIAGSFDGMHSGIISLVKDY